MSATFENISKVEHSQQAFDQAFRDNLYYTRGQAIYTATQHDLFFALAHTVRDYMMYNWQQNVDCYFRQNPKFVYYLVGRVPGWAAVGKEPALHRHLRAGARFDGSGIASIWPRSCASWISSQAWATAAWGGFPPALWIRWRR